MGRSNSWDDSIFGNRPLAAMVAICGGKFPFSEDEVKILLERGITNPREMMTTSPATCTPEMQVLMVKYYTKGDSFAYWRIVPSQMANRPSFVVPDAVVEYVLDDGSDENKLGYVNYVKSVLTDGAPVERSQRNKVIRQCGALLNHQRQDNLYEFNENAADFISNIALHVKDFSVSPVIRNANILKELPGLLIKLYDGDDLPQDLIDNRETLLTPKVLQKSLSFILGNYGAVHYINALIGIAKKHEYMPELTTDIVDSSIALALPLLNEPGRTVLSEKLNLAYRVTDTGEQVFCNKAFGFNSITKEMVISDIDHWFGNDAAIEDTMALFSRTIEYAKERNYSMLSDVCGAIGDVIHAYIVANPDKYDWPSLYCGEAKSAFTALGLASGDVIDALHGAGQLTAGVVGQIYTISPESMPDDRIIAVLNSGDVTTVINSMNIVNDADSSDEFISKISSLAAAGQLFGTEPIMRAFEGTAPRTAARLAQAILRFKDMVPEYSIPQEAIDSHVDAFKFCISNASSNRAKKWKEYLGIGIEYRAGTFVNYNDGVQYDTVIFPSSKVEWMAGDLKGKGDNSNGTYGTQSLFTYEQAVALTPKGWRLPTMEDFNVLDAVATNIGGTGALCTGSMGGTDVCGLHISATGVRHGSTKKMLHMGEAYFWLASDDFDPDIDIEAPCAKVTPGGIQDGNSMADNGLGVRYVRDLA